MRVRCAGRVSREEPAPSFAQARVTPIHMLICSSDPRGMDAVTSGTTIYGWTSSYSAITGLDRWGRGYPGNPASPIAAPAEGIIQGSGTARSAPFL